MFAESGDIVRPCGTPSSVETNFICLSRQPSTTPLTVFERQAGIYFLK